MVKKSIIIYLCCISWMNAQSNSSVWNAWGGLNPNLGSGNEFSYSASLIIAQTLAPPIGKGSPTPPSILTEANNQLDDNQDDQDENQDSDTGHSDGDSSDPTGDSGVVDTDSGNTDQTAPPDSGSGTYDSDDDVPTLLSIRSKIHTLQQELQSQMEDTRGTTQVYNPETNSTQSKEVALSDLYDLMRVDQEQARNAEEAKQTEIDSEKENVEDLKETFEEDINEAMDEITEATIKAPTSKTLDTKFELDIGEYNFYMDPMKDLYSGGIDTGFDWDDLSSWVSVIIGAIAVIIYFTKVRLLINKVMETLAIAPMSSPVTSLTFFGTSIGTLGLMLIKIGAFAVLFGGTLLSSILVLLESKFSVGENSLGIAEVITDFTSILTGGGIMANATSLLFDLIPIVSISSMVMIYSAQAFLVWLFISLTVSTSKTAT